MNAVTAGRMWSALAAAVLAYEVLCPEEQLLSRGVDRARARHRAVDAMVTAAVTITAAHLLRWIPARVDPFVVVLHRSRRLRSDYR